MLFETEQDLFKLQVYPNSYKYFKGAQLSATNLGLSTTEVIHSVEGRGCLIAQNQDESSNLI